MNTTSRILSLTLIAAVLAGCRTDPSVALLEAEMRWLEDQYYLLEDQYRDKCQELESCRLSQQAADADEQPTEAAGADDAGSPSSRRRPQDKPLSVEPPRVEGLPPTPGVMDTLPDLGIGVRPSSYETPVDPNITHILLNRLLTGGYNRDSLAGDEGLMVVLEPRNAAGQFVPVAGEMDIELKQVDAQDNQSSTVRWKVTAAQASDKLRRSMLGRGIHLELPWPGEPPPSSQYDLIVHFTASEGQKLKTEREISIDSPSTNHIQWTPVPQESAQSPNASVPVAPAPVVGVDPSPFYFRPDQPSPIPTRPAIEGPQQRWTPEG